MAVMAPARPELGEPVRRATQPRRRSGAVVPVLLVALVLVAVASTIAVRSLRDGDTSGRADGTGPPPAATPTVTTTTRGRNQALHALLDERSRAVLTRDAAAWLATVDPAAGDFAARQAVVFENLAPVPLQAWRYELAGNGPALSSGRRVELAAEDAWVVRVVLVYRLQNSGSGAVRREQYLTVVQRNGRLLIAGDRDGRTAVDLWDLGPVHVLRSARSLLIGTADDAALAAYAGPIDRAAGHVDEVWGADWPRTVVVMVPRDQTQMAALLARDSGGLDQIAAVTTGEIGLDTAATSADRIILNPDGFAKLGPTGSDVVLTHEITHVATRATTTTAVPIWLSEGFADYVAYLPTGLTPQQIARDVLSLVPQGTAPTSLPESDDFDAAVTDIAPAYSSAWLAVHLIAERYGQGRLLDFYRAVANGGGTASSAAPSAGPGKSTASQGSVDTAFASVLGTDQARFVADWRAEMARLAG
jgi:hypothetical protein